MTDFAKYYWGATLVLKLLIMGIIFQFNCYNAQMT